MLDQARNSLIGESTLRYVVSVGAGLNMLAIGIVMSLIKPMPVFAASMGWFAGGLAAGVAAVIVSVNATTRPNRFTMFYRASIGLTAVSLILFACGIAGWIGAS